MTNKILNAMQRDLHAICDHSHNPDETEVMYRAKNDQVHIAESVVVVKPVATPIATLVMKRMGMQEE